MSVPQQTRPQAILGRPRKLFELPFLDAAGYDVACDGERFLMVQPVEPDRTKAVHVILNWGQELERLLPANN